MRLEEVTTEEKGMKVLESPEPKNPNLDTDTLGLGKRSGKIKCEAK